MCAVKLRWPALAVNKLAQTTQPRFARTQPNQQRGEPVTPTSHPLFLRVPLFMQKRLLAIAAVSVVLLIMLFQSQRRSGPLKVSGFIESDEVRVGSRVGGRVKAVPVAEGQSVPRGELLVELEPFQLLEQKAQADALLAEAQAEFERLTAGFRPEEIAQAKARHDQLAAFVKKLKNGTRAEDLAVVRSQVELAQGELGLAKLKHQRVEALYAKQAATPDELDQAATELRVKQSLLEVRRSEFEKYERGTREEDLEEAEAQWDEANQAWQLKRNGYRREEVAQAKAAVESATAAANAIQRQLDELRVTAPVDGVVEALDLQPGDLVGANSPVLSLVDTSHLWVRAYVPENRLNLKVGQEVQVTVDSLPNERFRGTITFISRQAEFLPGNVQTPEERSKQVFRIKVTLEETAGRLRPGISADVVFEESMK